MLILLDKCEKHNLTMAHKWVKSNRKSVYLTIPVCPKCGIPKGYSPAFPKIKSKEEKINDNNKM